MKEDVMVKELTAAQEAEVISRVFASGVPDHVDPIGITVEFFPEWGWGLVYKYRLSAGAPDTRPWNRGACDKEVEEVLHQKK